MAIYKQRGSEYWWVSIYMGRNRPRVRKSTGVTDRAEAEMIEAAMKRALRGDVTREKLEALLAVAFPEEEPVGVPVDQAWDTFVGLPEVELAAETLRKMRTSWRRFVRWGEENWPSVERLNQVTPQMALGYADWLRDKTNKRKTYNNAKNDVKTIFQRLLYRAGMSENPFSNIPNLRTTDSLHGRAFTREEERRILEVVKGREWEGVCLAGLYTGLRLGDISQLRWDHVQGGWLRVMPGKTERHRIAVVMPLHARVRSWLETWERTSDYIFPERQYRHGKTYHAADFSRVLEAGRVADSDGAYLSFHCWRHTFRTRLAEKCVPKEIAQKLGGWTTDLSELYNHDMTGLQRAVAALE
jgi:integrase